MISLASELLPAIPDAVIFGTAEGEQAEAACESVPSKFLADNPELLERFSTDLLALVLQVHDATVTPQASYTSPFNNAIALLLRSFCFVLVSIASVVPN